MIKIVKGEDRLINLFFVTNNDGVQIPYDLTGWTTIEVYFKNQDETLLTKSTVAYSTFAQALYSGVTFTALTAGTAGNSISLVFDGSSNILEILDAWNTTNPSNQVGSNATSGATILPAGTVNLANAQAGLTDVNVVSATLGQVTVQLHSFDTINMLSGRSLSFMAEIDNGVPPVGTLRKILFENVLEVVEDNF